MNKIKVKFPKPFGKYYPTLVKNIYNVFLLSGMCDIELVNPEYEWDAVFYVYIDDKKVLFDLGDFETIQFKNNSRVISPADYHLLDSFECTILKRTCMRTTSKVHPMGPLMIQNHNTPVNFKQLLEFKTDGIEPINKFYYNQRNIGNAVERRTAMYKKLGLRPGHRMEQPVNYWRKALESEYNPMLPGANLHVFDRALAEIMFLGATVMHPKIDVIFPYNKKLVPGEHYIEINHDSSDVLEKMDGTQTGAAAKEFMQCAKPENLVKWWMEII